MYYKYGQYSANYHSNFINHKQKQSSFIAATYCPTLSFKEWNYTCFKGFMYGSICYRICPAGFILPPRENGVIMCQKNRTWTREFPDCIGNKFIVIHFDKKFDFSENSK